VDAAREVGDLYRLMPRRRENRAVSASNLLWGLLWEETAGAVNRLDPGVRRLRILRVYGATQGR
jgi:hypothetical protein